MTLVEANRCSIDSVAEDDVVLTMIDLFAGCGGLTAGFVETGRYRPVAAVEHDFAAAASYAANFGEDHVHFGEIEDWVTAGRVPSADVVVGGPPCQGFSNLGHRRINDPRNGLWRYYVQTLLAVEPQAFLLENVDRFAVSSQLLDLRRETDDDGLLRNYRLDVHVVRATDHGAAQLRRRTIVIGTHRDHPRIIVPRKQVPSSEWTTAKTALSGIVEWIDPADQALPDRMSVAFGRPVAGRFTTTELHRTRHYTNLSLDRFAHIPPGGNRLDLPDRLKARCWIGHDTGSLDVMGRMHWDRPSVTIRTEFFKPEKGRYLHPEQHRAISHHEAARLQGFRDDRRWCGNKSEIARQIGNAVPVQLATSMARHIADYIG
jgi:DNA (cytosine-5)-methyltransferase 1